MVRLEASRGRISGVMAGLVGQPETRSAYHVIGIHVLESEAWLEDIHRENPDAERLRRCVLKPSSP